MLHIKDTIRKMQQYRGGRTAHDLSRDGIQTAPPIKLSSNELPFGPLPGVVEAVAAVNAEINRYPQPRDAALLDTIGRVHCIDPAGVIVSNGTATIIHALLELTASPTAEVVHPWRTFEAVRNQLIITGTKSVGVPLVDEQHDLDRMLELIGPDTAFVYVCNPNNPNGAVIEEARLRTFLSKVPGNTMVVLDEAYIHFAEGAGTLSGLTLLEQYRNLVVLRTFSKAYGLAALRVGFAACHPDIAVELGKVVAPFSVTDAAAAAAIAAMEPAALAEMQRRVGLIIEERERVTAAFAERGIPLAGTSAANFFFVTGQSDTRAVAAAFERYGLIVRPYPEDGVRITVGSRDQNERLIAVATEMIARGELACAR